MGQLVPGFDLVSGILQGNAAAAQAKARAAEIARDAQLAGVQATEGMASRIEDLQRTVGNIRALSAQRGVSANDPSGMAIIDAAQLYTDRNNERAAFNRRQGLSSADLAAQAARQQGNAAATSYYMQGAGNFIKDAAPIAASAFGH